MDSDQDADLARAIELSLNEENARRGRGKVQPKKKAPPIREVVEISSDEEDVAIIPAPSTTRRSQSAVAPTQAQPPPPLAAAGPLSFLSDRAQLERERLARQKRLRGPSPSPPPASSGEDDEDGASSSEGSARKRARMDSGVAPKNSADSRRRSFPEGAILRIDTQHATKAKSPCIRLSEVLGPREDIAFAILSAFVVDPAWLYSFFDPETPVVLVADPNMCGGGGQSDSDDDDRPRKPTMKNVFPNWIRVCPPLNQSGYGCMHMKYMLLFAKSGALRIVVGSANLVPYDWRDVENYVFILDIPRAVPGAGTVKLRAGEQPGEAFPAMLAAALRATGVEEALEIMRRQGHDSLPLPTLVPSAPRSKSKEAPTSPLERGWDWTRVRAALVPSIPGKWQGWAGDRAVLRNGQARLLRAVLILGCSLEDGVKSFKGKTKGANRTKGPEKAAESELQLDCLTSSIGNYTPPWLAVFRLCASGRAKGLQAWLDRGRKKTPPQGPTRILYPTLETVMGTTLGEEGAGTMFCRRAQWVKIAALMADEKTGLHMRDARSRSGPVGMHTKMVLGTLPALPVKEVESDDSVTESDTDTDTESEIEVVEAAGQKRPHAWLFVGSHNFTPSAWGTLSGSGFNPQLSVNNYELGVVVRLETPDDVDAAVAWERPARPYIKGDVPWVRIQSYFFTPSL
ncbi:phospholipase D/nuclease [Mycena pura]|uniref:Phospholipase D/nuclease n=1 Tax=Mycena pura TaxID=153505 RepID=A0AAD6USH6_9AGAR|nr:phospholipase D/nuclease [Mycena pura]